MQRIVFTTFGTVVILLLAPFLTSAHEVYVLPQEAIQQALITESKNPFSAYYGNEFEFFFWGMVVLVVALTILFASVFRLFEKQSAPTLFFFKRIAHPLVRFTVGLTLIVYGGYGVLYGPELPLSLVFGLAGGAVQILLLFLGIAILTGVYVRTMASIAAGIYLYSLLTQGFYVLSYINHLGAYLFLVALGSGALSLNLRMNARHVPNTFQSIVETLRPLAYPLLRIGFGLAIICAAIWAKFLHSELAYQVVVQYNLTQYLPFDPLFVVLGAFIIEVLAGAMMLLGVAVRWTALFLTFWIIMGHIVMQEDWWVHIILFGGALAIFCHGYDRWSLEGRYLRRDGREPVF